MIQPFTPTVYFNHCFDKQRFQHFLYWFFRKSRHGHSRTVQFLEKLKALGFQSATEAGFSISLEDLKIPSTKSSILYSAEYTLFEAELKNTSSCLTAIEKSQQVLDLWHRTSERLKHEVLRSFQISDFLNPVYLMAFSGARGNISQIRQLIGMRGLMADPQGQIVDFPIRSNFREGLTLTEYLISCSGARKGIVDTALRTAASGYLTRRLVDVAHHVLIGQLDCQTSTGVFLEDLYDQKKKILTLQERLVGRILAENIVSKHNKHVFIGSKNQEITQPLSVHICQHRQKVFIRSPLTCQSSQFICQLCYGWNLAEGQCVSIGEAIGILAAQSIGEPGTQLTMRTFHTGGVFTGTLTDQIYASLTGHVYFSAICPGLLIRTQQGQIAFLTKKKSVLNILPIQGFQASFSKPLFWKKTKPCPNWLSRVLESSSPFVDKKYEHFPIQFQNQITHLSLKLQCMSSTALFKNKAVSWIFQASTLLYVRQGETVEKQQLISEIPAYTQASAFESEQEILSSASGEIFFDNFVFLEKTKLDLKSSLQFQNTTVHDFGEFWILFGHILQIGHPTATFFKKYDLLGQVPCFQIFINSGLKDVQKRALLFFKRKGYIELKESPLQREVASPLATSLKIFRKWKAPVVYRFQNQQSSFFRFHRHAFILRLNRQGAYSQRATSRKIDVSKVQMKYTSSFLNSGFKPPQLLPKFPTNMKRHKVVWKPLIFSLHNSPPPRRSIPAGPCMRIGACCFLRISIFLRHSAWTSNTQHNMPSMQGWEFFGEDKQKYNSTFLKKFVHSRAFKKKKSKQLLLISKRKKFFKPGRFFIRKHILDFYFDCVLCIAQKFYFLRSMHTRFDPLCPQKTVYFVLKTQPNNKCSGVCCLSKHNRRVNKKHTQLSKQYAIRAQKSKLMRVRTGFRKTPKVAFFAYLPYKNLRNLYGFWMPSKKKKIALKHIKLRLFCFIKNKILKPRKGKKLRTSRFNFEKLLWSKIQAIYPKPFLKTGRKFQNMPHLEIISQKEHFRNFENQIWIRYFLTTPMGEVLETMVPQRLELLVLEFSDLFAYAYTAPVPPALGQTKFLGALFRTGEQFMKNAYMLVPGQMIAKTERSILFRKADACVFNDQSVLYVKHGELLLKGQRVCSILYRQQKTGDIVQGIPKIEEIFEARKKSNYSFQKLALFSKDFSNYEQRITQYLRSLQKSVVNNIQRIYCGQGVYISDKHIEIIVRQMTSNVWILDPGQTGLLYGEILPLHWIERINSVLISNQVLYEPILLGMTKTCLEASSFLSAASFQETTRVLGRAALQNQIDFVRGLKQNIILGNFMPAGTGCFLNLGLS